MGKITRRRQFLADLLEAWTFIASDSEARADEFALDLERRLQTLADTPSLGVARFPNHPGFRLFPFGRYIVIYQPIPDGSSIDLVRFLNAARDYHRFFED